jgi:hypothetical protein
MVIIGKMFFFGGILCLSLWIGWMFADNEPPYVYDVAGSHMFPDPAPQGSMVTIDWKLSAVRRTCPGSVQRFFRDLSTGNIAATLDTTELSRVVRVGDNRLPRSFQLPPGLPRNVGYSALGCFECNLLQHFWPLCVMTPELAFRTQ